MITKVNFVLIGILFIFAVILAIAIYSDKAVSVCVRMLKFFNNCVYKDMLKLFW